MNLKHAPTPWHLASTADGYFTCIERDDRLIARCGSSDFLQAERDAAFVVRAVNAHEELIDTLRMVIEDLQEDEYGYLIKMAEQAIAKAEGE